MNSRRRIAVILVAAVGGLCLALVLAAPPINQARARNDPLPDQAPEAIIALGSGFDRLGRPGAYTVERLVEASALARRYPTALVLTTRTRHGRTGATTDSVQRALLANLGARWVMMDGAGNTREEAVAASRQLPPAGATILVVTSQTHTRRACAAFAMLGYRVVCRMAPMQGRLWWQPTRDLLYEAAAWGEYRWRGWIR